MSLQNETTSQIKPGDDFYRHVNQKWLEKNPVPADKSRYGAFTVLDDQTTDRLKELLEKPITAHDNNNTSLAKRFYQSVMDQDLIEKTSAETLVKIKKTIDEISDKNGLHAFITDIHAGGRAKIWDLELDIDEKNSQKYVICVRQSGLGLPDRDFYFEKNERFTNIRAKYLEFLADLFELLGCDNPKQKANHVLAIETKLAKASSNAVERRDVEAQYNVFTINQLNRDFKDFDWQTYLEHVGLTGTKELIVSQPKFLRNALEIMASEPLSTWKDYLLAHNIIPFMNALPKKFDDLYFSFFQKTLNGSEEKEPRFEHAVHAVIKKLPEPAGELYVKHYFDESAKKTITNLVENIKVALRTRITELEWMSDQTKQKAFEKLDTFSTLLGYPEQWRDYSKLTLNASHFENILALKKNEWLFDIDCLNKPVNPNQWLMSPAVVNAYYWPNTNGITFPAAILQPPFFDPKGDFAANFGGIGMVIGHEIIHGFDDKGSKYDKFGNLKSWWIKKDREAFEKRAKQLEKQYDAYEIEGQHVKGALTLGENIADLGGMLIAFDAMKTALISSGKNESIDGYSPEQRFFLSQARIWRNNVRPELELRTLVSDPHSPATFRVNGVVTNVDAFYEAFDVDEHDRLYTSPEDRIRIW